MCITDDFRGISMESKHLELRGQLGALLEELYRGVECEVMAG